MGHIRIKNLGKAYKHYPSRFARLKEWLHPSKPRHTLRWILKGIDIEINPGEAVGIIGINGAGKSTLLKMVTGTAQATVGSITMTGRVAALLELGMGFHPDFTGRQNVYMAGQLLGMTRAEITQALPEIEAFAEIGSAIDHPVRMYSSGMQVRLAFSLATAVRPDILIIDEALSVGDAYFQHKSFARIREFREKGTTLLIVSHDKQAIISVCDRAVLLGNGQKIMEGDPESIMDYYNAMLASDQEQQISQNVLENGKLQTISGTGEASVHDIGLLDAQGNLVKAMNVGQKTALKIEVRVQKDLPKLVLGFGIRDRLGQTMYGTNTALLNQTLLNVKAGSAHTFIFNFDMNLGVGDYSINTSISSDVTHLDDNYEWRDLALLFSVVNLDKSHFVGYSWLNATVTIQEN